MAGSGFWVHGLARLEAVRDRRVLLKVGADRERVGFGVELHPKREIPPVGALIEVGGYLLKIDEQRWGLSSTAVVTVLREPPDGIVHPAWVVVASGRVASPSQNEARIGSSRYFAKPDGTLGEDVTWLTCEATRQNMREGAIVRVTGELLSPRRAGNGKLEAPRVVNAVCVEVVAPAERSRPSEAPAPGGEDW